LKTKADTIKIWELALAAALCVTLCAGLWAQAAQNRLEGELVRLHVVAESDSAEDQAVKLKVRDAVISHLTPMLEGAKNAAEAGAIIESELTALRLIAKGVTAFEDKSCDIKATLATESLPRRDYDTFSLPAGDYVSLRISLGDGGGKNWWCVVFPPLCVNSVEAENAFGGLSEGSAEIIAAEDGGGYTLKFHILEIFERIRQAFS
jgi:stage II sporulation protein R